jgi:hypothetical protein
MLIWHLISVRQTIMGDFCAIGPERQQALAGGHHPTPRLCDFRHSMKLRSVSHVSWMADGTELGGN